MTHEPKARKSVKAFAIWRWMKWNGVPAVQKRSVILWQQFAIYVAGYYMPGRQSVSKTLDQLQERYPNKRVAIIRAYGPDVEQVIVHTRMKNFLPLMQAVEELSIRRPR